MPPRKSNASVISNGPEDGAEATPAKAAKDGISIEDLSLPKSMIQRLAKGVLPANTQIQKDALLALHKSATVFVSYIASNSNENAQSGGKKTISPQDVMAALKDCEFEDFLPRLEAELKKYNEIQCDKRNTYRRKVKEEKAAVAPVAQDGDDVSKEGERGEHANGSINGHEEVEDEDRPFKKFKAEDGSAVPPDADMLDDSEMHDEPDGETEVYEHHDDEEDEEEGDEVPEEDEDEEETGVTLAEDPEADDLPRNTFMHPNQPDSDIDSDSD